MYVKINPSEPDGRKKAKERAKEAYSKIKSGSDFGEIAQTYSQDMSRIKGGDVGFVHRGMMPHDIEKAALSLKVGQIKRNFGNRHRVSYLKSRRKRASRQVSFKEIKDKLKKRTHRVHAEKQIRRPYKRLRENAKIQYIQ